MQITLFEYSWLFIKTSFFVRKIHKNREAKHIYDTASCVLVSISRVRVWLGNSVIHPGLPCDQPYLHKIKICYKISLYGSNGFAFHTVMILTVLIIADFVKAVDTTFDL